MGQIHFKNPVITQAFGEWIEFSSLNTIIGVNDYREHNINLKDKFGVDLNLMLDPLRLDV